jgi:hypothetical protein
VPADFFSNETSMAPLARAERELDQASNIQSFFNKQSVNNKKFIFDQSGIVGGLDEPIVQYIDEQEQGDRNASGILS